MAVEDFPPLQAKDETRVAKASRQRSYATFFPLLLLLATRELLAATLLVMPKQAKN